MSYTQLVGLNAAGEVIRSVEFRNAWRGAMHVWGMAAVHILHEQESFVMYNSQRVWDTWKQPEQPEWFKITMLSTFDQVMVRPEEFPRVAAAFREFAKRYGEGSLLEQAEALEGLKDTPGLFAVGWNQTSVSGDLWSGRNDEDEAIPFDFKEEKHWFLFDSLEDEEEADQH